jgi:aldose 1-epimerase
VNLRGGGLRALTVSGSNLVEPYPAGEQPPYCAGAVLFPWPNRVRDGRWSQRGIEHHLPINEPELGNAAHGLVQDVIFRVDAAAPSAVTISTTVPHQPGYPFAVGLSLTYQLTDNGIEVHNRVTNECDQPAPVCLGVHPYLRVGDVPTDHLTVCVDAGTYFLVDKQLIPTVERRVGGTAVDLRDGLPIAGTALNHCYGHVRVIDGRGRHRIEAADGRAVELWTDESFGYVQVYICPRFPRIDGTGHPGRIGHAVAIEPMTAPPDAFNSGVGLRWLAPSETWEASWGISLLANCDGARPLASFHESRYVLMAEARSPFTGTRRPLPPFAVDQQPPADDVHIRDRQGRTSHERSPR